VIGGFFAERNIQIKASYASSPPCEDVSTLYQHPNGNMHEIPEEKKIPGKTKYQSP